MRTFVKLRETLATHRDLARKVEEHDRQIAVLFDSLRKLLVPDVPKNPPSAISIRRTDLLDPGDKQTA